MQCGERILTEARVDAGSTARGQLFNHREMRVVGEGDIQEGGEKWLGSGYILRKIQVNGLSGKLWNMRE